MIFIWTLFAVLTGKIASVSVIELPKSKIMLAGQGSDIAQEFALIDEDDDEAEPERVGTIKWQDGQSWGFGCTFDGNDLFQVKVSGEECGPLCDRTPDCTHYAWSKEDNGTCWIKFGPISKRNATLSKDAWDMCGLSDFSLKWKLCDMEKSYLEFSEYIRNKTEMRRARREQKRNSLGDDYDEEEENEADMEDEEMTRMFEVCDMSTIRWNEEANFAFACEFPGNNVARVHINGEKCGETCDRRRECTHYTWTKHDNGTCWLKSGPVSKADAVRTHDLSMICGITNLNFKLSNCQKSKLKISLFGNNGEKQADIKQEKTASKQSKSKEKQKGNNKHVNVQENTNSKICNYTEIAWSWRSNYGHGCDFPGNDLSTHYVSGEECGAICHRTPACSHYVWAPKGAQDGTNGTCYLKKGYVTRHNATLVNDLFTICGLVDFYSMIATCRKNLGLTKHLKFVTDDPSTHCHKMDIFVKPLHIRFPQSFVVVADLCESIIQEHKIYGVDYLYYLPKLYQFFKLIVRF